MGKVAVYSGPGMVEEDKISGDKRVKAYLITERGAYVLMEDVGHFAEFPSEVTDKTTFFRREPWDIFNEFNNLKSDLVSKLRGLTEFERKILEEGIPEMHPSETEAKEKK